MSEDKTQNGYEGSQKLDFQEAKEMTVGEAVRKEAEINAGVTETDSILDKYIKQHREEVASQKFSKKIEADGDTSPLDAFIQKQRQEFADSGLIGQSNQRQLLKRLHRSHLVLMLLMLRKKILRLLLIDSCQMPLWNLR